MIEDVWEDGGHPLDPDDVVIDRITRQRDKMKKAIEQILDVRHTGIIPPLVWKDLQESIKLKEK